MKAYDIYKRTCAIMFEREGEDKIFLEKYPELLNLLICEAFPYENANRISKGKTELTHAPEIRDGDDEVDMCDEICNTALPYGLAAYFYQDDGEVYKSAMYRERFVDALSEASRCCFSAIEDIYGGDEE